MNTAVKFTVKLRKLSQYVSNSEEWDELVPAFNTASVPVGRAHPIILTSRQILR